MSSAVLHQIYPEASDEFLKLVIDSIPDHIVVIDEMGNILFANKSWTEFGLTNACTVSDSWRHINYLDVCDRASKSGDPFGEEAGSGIRSVIEQRVPEFYLEYPCHSPNEKRWFMMHVTLFRVGKNNFFVISHRDITLRKLAEEEVICQARNDGLTKIPNRRTFDKFLNEEWRRCLRNRNQISLALIDIDHFKLLNDTYGHPKGDECLTQIAAILTNYACRPSDICARYGGEEFAILWGQTSMEQAKGLISPLLDQISGLNIPNPRAPSTKYVTASIGLATLMPNQNNSQADLIKAADTLLYRAKENGRNRIEY